MDGLLSASGDTWVCIKTGRPLEDLATSPPLRCYTVYGEHPTRGWGRYYLADWKRKRKHPFLGICADPALTRKQVHRLRDLYYRAVVEGSTTPEEI